MPAPMAVTAERQKVARVLTADPSVAQMVGFEIKLPAAVLTAEAVAQQGTSTAPLPRPRP